MNADDVERRDAVLWRGHDSDGRRQRSSAPVTPAAVEAELRRVARKLEARTDALAGLLTDAATADVTYKLAHAKALLRAEGDTVAEREAAALLAVEAELRDRKHAEAVADACREAVRSLRDQLSAVQSVNANVRYSAGLEQR
jgi:hypothetical protein